MAVFKCKMCGGALEITVGQTTAVCEYCGTTQTLPRLDDDKRANLYDRANHFRRNNEFDKAMSIYEQILNEDGTDAEAYWSLVLCRYGIEYVEDPATHKRVPTVNRAQFTSIFDDDNYKSALAHADGGQKAIYEQEAAAINEIQKGILAISQKEEPFDVFICYKETDQNGRRTQDSVLANDLYHQLTQEGFKVFFSRITLEDKLGTAYEPYIFAALNSAKVMVVLGTRPEHFSAVWVKNEWSRYLGLIKGGANKILIPAYRDMDPYDLPEEFSHLQAQDMSKLGFMQDLIRGIKKLAGTDEPKTVVKETTVVQSAGGGEIAPLLKRAFMFLEDNNWVSANEYCEKVLDMDPENAEAYLGKLMAELECPKRELLKEQELAFEERDNYKKALRFGAEALKKELEGTTAFIKERNETARLTGLYDSAVKAMRTANSEGDYQAAARKFEAIAHFREAKAKAEECREKAEKCRQEAEAASKDEIYNRAVNREDSPLIQRLQWSIEELKSIPGWRDADRKVQEFEARIAELEKKAEAEEKRRAEEKIAQKRARNEKIKKLACLCAAALAAVTVITLVVIKVVLPAVKYSNAKKMRESGDYNAAVAAFEKMEGYKDSEEQILATYYAKGEALLASGDYDSAVAAFRQAEEYADAAEKILEVNYARGEALLASGDYDSAAIAFRLAEGYNDAAEKVLECYYEKGKFALSVEFYDVAIKSFESAESFGDAREKVSECYYMKGESLLAKEDFYGAFLAFSEAGNYKDAPQKSELCAQEVGRSLD